MKKIAFALAAVVLCSGAAAQSSVTIFGYIDATLAYGKGSISNKTQLANSSFNASRFGFRGVEDLGGGNSAGFWLEAGLNVDNGTGAATSTNNQSTGISTASAGTQGLTFNRRSTLSLMGTWGELRLGRDYMPHFWVLALEPFGANGMPATQNLLGATAGAYAAAGGANSPAVRASNSITYWTPNVGGFFGQFMHFYGENASNAVNKDDGGGNSVRLSYAAGPVKVEAGWAKTRYVTGDITTTALGGFYDFAVAKVYALASRDNVSGALPDGKGWTLGVLVPIGVSEIRGSYGKYKTNATGSPAQNKLALSYAYNLSKRTVVYTTYARLKNSGGSAQSLYQAVTGPNTTSTGYDVGIRHLF